MSTKKWIGATAVLTAIAFALFVRLLNAPSHLERITARDLSRYPDTGYLHGPLPLDAIAAVQRIPVVVTNPLDASSNRLARVDHIDAIHPDEDLLLGTDGAGPIPAQPDVVQELTPAEPRQTDQSEAAAPLPTSRSTEIVPSPAASPPGQAPPQATPPQAFPRERLPEIPSAPTEPNGKPTSGATDKPRNGDEKPGNSSRVFDPNMPPSADEDLLIGQPPQAAPSENVTVPPGSQPPRQDQRSNPIELLPTRPAPDASIPLESSPVAPATPSQPGPPVAGPPVVQPHVTPPPSAPQQVTPPSTGLTSPPASAAIDPSRSASPIDPHAAVFAESLYPSAKKCRECHQQIYDEWAVSGHAYASISPMFQKFEQTITCLTRGTLGYFCMRCHAPIATALSFPRYGSLMDAKDLPDSAREGVTCVACHRVREQYGKANGERRIEPGDIYDPVYGSGDGSVLADVIRRKSEFKVKTSPGDSEPGLDIHQAVIQFPQLSDSSFCASCHQVFVAPGIELEVVWEQYRASPACKQGISCQDCHMGIVPGVAAGYDVAPVAIVNNKPISPDRKHSNHSFHGPGYPIAHPGVFPFNKDAEKWSTETWLKFDWRGGWGREEFEDALDDGKIAATFPKEWENSDDRYDAREVVDANLKKLLAKRDMRRRLYENSSHVEGPIFDTPARTGRALKFHYVVSNLSNGHNMPSGSLGAQPQLWLNVALTGPNGQHLWESGYVDANGDICDLHSLEVAAGRAVRDQQLFNLQTKFLISHVKGTDREMYLPINTDIDQLPFIRPSAFPVTVMNHPPFIRMEAHSIPALGSRKACYKVPARFLQQSGRYRLSVRMRSRAEPIYFMRFCNATPEMERSMNEWMLDFHEHATEFWVP